MAKSLILEALNSSLSNAMRQIFETAEDKYRLQEEAYTDLSAYFKKCHDAAPANLMKLLMVEKIQIGLTLSGPLNTRQEYNSWKTAYDQIQGAIQCYIDFKRDPQSFFKYIRSAFPKPEQVFDRQGLPNDYARQFFKSHAARFDNRLTYTGDGSTKSSINFITQRRANVAKMEEVYIDLQKTLKIKYDPGPAKKDLVPSFRLRP